MNHRSKSIMKAVAVVTVMSLSQAALAGQTLSCTVGGAVPHGSAQIEVFGVTNRPDLKVFKIDLGTSATGANPAKKGPHVVGYLTAQLGSAGQLVASGVVFSVGDDNSTIINPETITLQGSSKPVNGHYTFTLYDADRVFQRGFGAGMNCQ